MDGVAALALLKGAYYSVVIGIDLNQVPTTIQKCLELVETCHSDLCDLIELRNEYLQLLQSQPKVLDRMNNIITQAHQGLAEVCALVEKCRPEAHGGRTPLRSRINWLLVDSNLFKCQEPII